MLAATYGVAIAKNHPFVDGNKRAAFLAVVLFLRRNGQTLAATTDEATDAMLRVAAGEFDLDGFAPWVVERRRPWRRWLTPPAPSAA